VMRHALLPAAVLLLAAGCGTGPGPASPPGSSDAKGSIGPTSVPSRASPPESSTSPSVSPTATSAPSSEPLEPDPAAFLQVCWALDGPTDEPTLPCEDAVTTALAALSVTAPTRVDVRYACADAASCPAPDADRAFVTVVGDDTATEVEVSRSPDGTIDATAMRLGVEASPPVFSAPEPGLAAIPGGPASLAGRPPYPLCGQEQTPVAGPYDEAARTCFFTGVLAGSPVEFLSRGAGTEGQPYVHLYRYSGTGGVELVTGEGGTWLRRFTGIGEASGGLVFDAGGMSTRREPVP